MGMAASQVRFLTLQDRKSTIGMRLGILSNRKMALTRDQNKAAKAYNEAYSQKKLQWYDSINGKYTDITYNAMMTPNAGNGYTPYLITDRNTGKVILDSSSTTVGLLGNSNSPQNSNHWSIYFNKQSQAGLYVGALPSTSTDRTMDSHMHCLAGIDGAHYVPGSKTYNQAEMAPYIIEQMMGVPNFDRNKFIYKGVSNKDITKGGYQKFVFSDVADKLHAEVGTNVSERSSVHLPVWEFTETKRANTNDGTLHAGMNISTGKVCYLFLDYNNTTINSSYSSNIDNDTTNMTNYLLYDTGNAYIDSSGNVHNFTGKEYWSTLYNNGAVIISKTVTSRPSVSADNDPNAADSQKLYSINYDNYSQYDWLGKNIKEIATEFVTDVNNSGLLKHHMSDSLVNNIAQITKTHMTDAYCLTNGSTYAGWYDEHDANADTQLYIRISKLPDELNTKDNGGVQWNYDKGLTKLCQDVEYVVTSGQEGDPVGYGTASGTANIPQAIAKQANAIATPIRINAANWATNSSGNLLNNNPNDPGADWVYAFSIKNLMDIAMYYINIAQQKLDNEESESSITQAALYNAGKTAFGFEDYMSGNNPEYTSPTNYNQGEMNVFVQGETKVASVFSIKSNFDMLNKKISHMSSLTGTAAEDVDMALFSTVYNLTGSQDYNMKGKLQQIISGDSTLSDKQLIALANMNAWICEALEQDYSTEGGVERINELLQKIKNTADLYTYDWCDKEHWETAQDEDHYPEAFYYDKNTTWGRRTQLFTQDSEDRVATEQLDIEGQLDVNQLHQFHFYEKLVKECLARGWTSNNVVADSEATSLHLQNGTWLINDNMAKSSSRIFEVADKEAREEALSEYEALQSELKIKEERIDTQMKKLETEQNAINTELNSLETIIKDNIQSTFKIFG